MRYGITIGILLAAALTDRRTGKVPNILIRAGLLSGAACLAFSFSGQHLLSCLLGMVIPILVCWLPFRMHAIGAGDIKLFLVIGCFHGGQDVIYCIFFAFLYAAGVSLGKLLSQKQLFTSLFRCIQYFNQIQKVHTILPYPGNTENGHRIHLSWAILLGFLTVMGVNICRTIPSFSVGWNAVL